MCACVERDSRVLLFTFRNGLHGYFRYKLKDVIVYYLYNGTRR